MERVEILNKINEIFKDTLDNDSLVITERTAAADVDEWDSLSHIQLVIAIEKTFKVGFTSAEIQSWADVGEMINCIQQKGV